MSFQEFERGAQPLRGTANVTTGRRAAGRRDAHHPTQEGVNPSYVQKRCACGVASDRKEEKKRRRQVQWGTARSRETKSIDMGGRGVAEYKHVAYLGDMETRRRLFRALVWIDTSSCGGQGTRHGQQAA